MSGLEQELNRYGGKIASGLRRLGEAIKHGAEEVKAEASATIEDLKAEGEKGIKWTKETGIPKAQEKLGKAAEVVEAHGGLTARRFGAGVREVLQGEEAREKAKSSQFEMAKDLFHRKVSRSSMMREFVDSEHARIEGFDNGTTSVNGIPVYPTAAHVKHLKEEFVPVRLYLTSSGIQARTYEQNPPEEHAAGKPQYTYRGERPATPDDLFQLQVSAEQVGAAIDTARSSAGYAAFRASKGN